ncbi:MAG: aminoacyl-histidine dipeptidase [Phocaeicola sp.]|nr:aminoacyl-histidine dipeptidase [Phocaeicola sp.]MDY5938697.1 aminoacyl-histidine dipeptidase [Phocaeicola sp.]
MSEILSLAPQNVWKHFYDLTQIPRPSGHMERVQAFLLEFGKKTGVETFMDEAGNVIYKKPATPGMEDKKVVILQAHMDMVPQANKGTEHDFVKDPIQTYIDGEWVKAKGTTLGSDNGMGVAAIMAVMEDKNLKHGPLVGLITSDEETGMFGAFGLKPGTVEGDILLNLDSEEEGELYIGCAGGEDLTAELEYKPEAVNPAHVALKIVVKGLRGGHSGVQIGEGLANANKLMTRFVHHAIKYYGADLASWEGGNMRNAVPRECEAILTFPESELEKLTAYAKECEKTWQEEFDTIEKNILVLAERTELPQFIVPAPIRDNVISALYACPNGVERYIPTIPDTVETSSNLAIVTIGEGKVAIKVLTRSSRETMKDYRNTAIENCFSMAGMSVVRSGGYSGWSPDVNSPILHAMKKSYQQQFGKEPKISVIHAGLECGIIGSVVPGLDMISFGPTLQCPHTPEERCHIPSVPKFYDFLIATLENTPKK